MTPHVRVLLASHDASPWLDEQIASLFAQTGVRVSVVASDDASTDDTCHKLADWARRADLQCLPTSATRFGNANRNFLRLIDEAPIGDADHVALSDHDDIWLPHKLARACECLTRLRAQAYSSDVIAFWPDGRECRIVKSDPQRPHDHLFESPGPGCTFVFPRAAYLELKHWLAAHAEHARKIKVHDWLIYAYARTHGWRWHIDDQAFMRYRQHAGNEIGANAGWAAVQQRWAAVRRGTYRHDVLAIADMVDDRSWVTDALRRMSPLDRLRLLLAAPQLRRRPRDRLVLGAFLLVMPGRQGMHG